ncbi:hypothetical protein SCHPADRAFT_924676 [Schizopora paradoxa]|uniref:Uncharacterized protein n=1 Tax=Schizopora paradoxa TaxID=27342 RepID=A0A0H2S4G1_9AGAM|nr:hypothetical protein SCHPADRAFT_924676 [Schizopora paradoxa]
MSRLGFIEWILIPFLCLLLVCNLAEKVASGSRLIIVRAITYAVGFWGFFWMIIRISRFAWLVETGIEFRPGMSTKPLPPLVVLAIALVPVAMAVYIVTLGIFYSLTLWVEVTDMVLGQQHRLEHALRHRSAIYTTSRPKPRDSHGNLLVAHGVKRVEDS